MERWRKVEKVDRRMEDVKIGGGQMQGKTDVLGR